MNRTIARVNRVTRVSRLGGVASAFSPTQLSGYVDSPYNIALLRTQGKLWQNTAMTVPATADGDPVRRIDCGGTYYDAPSDAARPLLYSEGSGKWSLSFDGVDDILSATITAIPQPSMLYVGLRMGSWVAMTRIIGDGTGDGNRCALLQWGATPRIGLYAGGSDVKPDLSTLPVGVWGSVAALFDGDSSTILLAGNSVQTQDGTGTEGRSGTLHLGNVPSGHPFTGRMNAVIICAGSHDDTTQLGTLNYLSALAP